VLKGQEPKPGPKREGHDGPVDRPQRQAAVGTGAVLTVEATTTPRRPQFVLTQLSRAGRVLRPGATVALTMHFCPQ
jgi:hypothetical protein